MNYQVSIEIVYIMANSINFQFYNKTHNKLLIYKIDMTSVCSVLEMYVNCIL